MKLHGHFMILAVAMVVAALPVCAQELAIDAAAATPGVYRDQTFGAGTSAGAFFSLGSIFADDVGLRRSRLRIGVRLGYTEYHASQPRDYRCSFASGCTYAPHTVRNRMGIMNWQLVLASYWGSKTRFDVAAGIATYTFRGDESPNRHGLTGSVAMSRRLLPGRRWWAAIDYTMHGRGVGAILMDDANNFSPPDHSLKAGIAYRLR